MKQAIGSTWIIQLMLLFILLFVGYIILTLNYSKVIKLKNETVSMLEKYDGLNTSSITLINNYLLSSGYTASEVCTSNNYAQGIYGTDDLTSNSLEPAEAGKKYYYCVKKYDGANTTTYYQIALFYNFNLPVIGEASRFNVKGTTTNFHNKDEELYAYTIDGSYQFNDGTNGGGSVIAYYTVNFDLNGASGYIPPQTIEEGEKATKPSNPTREGYTFKGWTLSGSSYNFNKSVYSDITLVAKWDKVIQVIPSLKDFIVSNATYSYNGYYDCTNRNYCEKTSLGNLGLWACSDYTRLYSVYSSTSECKNALRVIYDSLPNRVYK